MKRLKDKRALCKIRESSRSVSIERQEKNADDEEQSILSTLNILVIT